ncbi:hypothetical protein E2542_SST17390 [Spatholobus suberectus]|nr:hypothetical protein E2542_SST17390 [Spatholobus suberectus]
MEEQAPRNNTDDPAAALPPLPPPPGRHGHGHDTYIVQFPKDQVYRVPPPENALIVEQYRNPTTEKKRRRCCCFCSRRFLLTLAIIVVAVVAIAGITLATLFFVFKPKAPGFTVSHVAVRGNKNSEYEVSLRVKNPNGRLGIGYENGDVSLLFRETKAATGKFPTLKQRRDEPVRLRLS